MHPVVLWQRLTLSLPTPHWVPRPRRRKASSPLRAAGTGGNARVARWPTFGGRWAGGEQGPRKHWTVHAVHISSRHVKPPLGGCCCAGSLPTTAAIPLPPCPPCQWCDAQGRPAVLLTKGPTGEDAVLVDYSTLRQADVDQVGAGHLVRCGQCLEMRLLSACGRVKQQAAQVDAQTCTQLLLNAVVACSASTGAPILPQHRPAARLLRAAAAAGVALHCYPAASTGGCADGERC